MAELTGRREFEKAMARAISRMNWRLRNELIDLLGDPPDFTKIPLDFWENSSAELRRVLRPLIIKAVLAAADAMIEGLPIGVEWELVNQAAVDWVSKYTFELVRGITDTTQRALQRSISRYYEDGETIGELINSITRIFSPSRARAIAVTEITRAAAQGEFLIAEDIRRQGIDMTAVWRTNADEIVCPICGPLEGKQREEWPLTASSGPPAHVNCRCWVNHELPRV